MSANGNNSPESTPISNMRMAGHLSNAEIEGFRNATLDASQLLAVGDHLAECSSCRVRTMPEAKLTAKLSHLQQDLVRHLTDEEMIAWMDAREVDDAGFVEAHLDRCTSCRHELADLHEFQRRLKPVEKRQPVPLVWAALAAAALIVFALVTARRPAAPPASAKAPVETHSAETAPVPRTVERAGILNELYRPEGQLLGEETKGAYHALSPVGIVVASDHPIFRWEAIPGATDYVVSVYDNDFRKVAESSKLKTNQWTPPAALPRGVRLSWQVAASVGSNLVRLPVPPAREAVFESLSAETANAIAEVRDAQHASPVQVGLLYARAGALEDAAVEFGKDPSAKDLLDGVKRLLQQ